MSYLQHENMTGKAGWVHAKLHTALRQIDVA